jgi:hypothetical protein
MYPLVKSFYPFKSWLAARANCYDAPMLMKPFSIQVLILKHKASQIDKMMTTSKETSKWISTNKRNSTEKPMSKRLLAELATIMEFSTPKERLKFLPKLEVRFKYQVDIDVDNFNKLCVKSNNEKSMQSTEMLSRKVYTGYIKDPFNKKTTMTYLKETLPGYKVPNLECNVNCSLPLYGVSYKTSPMIFSRTEQLKKLGNISTT